MMGWQMPRRRVQIGLVLFAAVLGIYIVFGRLEWSAGYNHSVAFDTSNNVEGSGTQQLERPTVSAQAPRILIVSALFPLAKSKHTHEEYRNWLGQFLGRISTDVYFYAPPSLEQVVRGTRPPATSAGNNDNSTTKFWMHLNTTYENAFSIPPLRGREEAYNAMHAKDREMKRHSPELYAVWNAKPFFLNEAVLDMKERFGKEYDYAFWVDAGSFRGEHYYADWPNPREVEKVMNAGAKDSILFPIQYLPSYKFRSWTADMGPIDADISEGSFFGGTPTAIQWYTSAYYTYHDHYLSLGHFVGKDQTFINSLFLLFPEHFTILIIFDPLDNRSNSFFSPAITSAAGPRCGSSWYYYEWILANASERERMEDKWMQGMPEWKKEVYMWANKGKGCPVIKAVGMEKALVERAFGPNWKRPRPSITIGTSAA